MMTRFVVASFLTTSILVASGLAQEAIPSPSAAGQQVAELIDQLNDDRFAQRERATQQLTDLGHKAVPALGKAAADERPEVSERAFKILATIKSKGSAEAKTAATKKLEELAKSENAGVAKKATDLLAQATESITPATRPRRPGIIFPRGRIPRIEIAPGRAGGGIRLGGVRGGVRRMRVVGGAGGEKEVEVTEGGRTVKVTENSDGITVKVTETKDGTATTKEYKAADEKELKKNHPEAHKLYKQYAGGGDGAILGGRGGIRFDFGGGRLGGALPDDVRERIADELKRALPEGTLPPGIVPGGGLGGDLGTELKRAEEELRKMLEGVGGPGGGIPPEFKKMIEEFERRAAPRAAREAEGAGADASVPKATGKKHEDDLDRAIATLRETLKNSKDEKKLLESLKKLEKLQAEQLELLKKKQLEIERKLSAGE